MQQYVLNNFQIRHHSLIFLKKLFLFFCFLSFILCKKNNLKLIFIFWYLVGPSHGPRCEMVFILFSLLILSYWKVQNRKQSTNFSKVVPKLVPRPTPWFSIGKLVTLKNGVVMADWKRFLKKKFLGNLYKGKNLKFRKFQIHNTLQSKVIKRKPIGGTLPPSTNRDASCVEIKKLQLARKNVKKETLRSNLTQYISTELKSRQEFVPIVGRYIDIAKCEPLHLKK